MKSSAFEVNRNFAIDFTGSGFHTRWMQTVLCDIHIELSFLIVEAVFKSAPHKANVAEYSIILKERKLKA